MLRMCPTATQVMSGLLVILTQITAAAQETVQITQLVDRGPMFYSSSHGERTAAVDARTIATLQQSISLDLDSAPLPLAIAAISRAAHVEISFRNEDVPVSHRVTLSAKKITVAAALTVALYDLNLDVRISQSGSLSLSSHSAPSASPRNGEQPAGEIVGVVTDADTHIPLIGAVIHVEGINRTAITGTDGKYSLSGVASGVATIVARRLGYLPLKHTVTINGESSTNVDFALHISPVSLDEVVTTVTGDEEKRSLGNSIGTLRVDSLVDVAPVTDLGSIVNARVPGVQVFFNGGLTGASPQINIRGQNSMQLSNQPLLYVDGVRVSNTSAGRAADSTSVGATSGRLNDILPEDIQSIEVVRGPSAATLYGTDAANGVILITTKHGAPGSRKWTLFGEQGMMSVDRDRFPYSYDAWGTTTDGTNTPTACGLQALATKACTVDSITRFSPLRDAATTPIGTGQHASYGLQVAGGNGALRYFASGGLTSELGALKLPGPDLSLLAAERGAVGVGDAERRPNALQKYNVRDNLTADLGARADLTLSTSLLSQDSRIPSSPVAEGTLGPGYRDASDGWAFGNRPAYIFAQHNDESITHITGSATTNWHTTDWLTNHAIAGIDFDNEYYSGLLRAGDSPLDPTGFRTNTKTATTLYSVDLGSSASYNVPLLTSAQTSVGVQYNRQLILINTLSANSLIPGCTTFSCGSQPGGQEGTQESVVAGAYAEQQLRLRPTLYLTGALRADGGSTFGRDFKVALYPKASASWVVSDEAIWPRSPVISQLRFRGAFGESGVEPSTIAALATERIFPAIVDGQPASAALDQSPGNGNLQPERDREWEGGLDADLFGARVTLSATYYDKTSFDDIVSVTLPASEGGSSETVNAGSVRNWGYEGQISIRALASKWLTWDLTSNGSINHNQLVKLAPQFAPIISPGGGSSIVAGYPLFSAFDYPILGYQDKNGDGIIEPNELTVGSTPVFRGQMYPKVQLTLGSTLGLFNSRFHANIQFDYRGGFRLFNQVLALQCAVGVCQALETRGASLADQARALAYTTKGTTWGYYEDASFTRLREVGLSYDMPQRVARVMRMRSAVITVAARNLALWTRYSGPDPEVASSPGQNTNVGAYSDLGGLPPSQYYVIRLSLGL